MRVTRPSSAILLNRVRLVFLRGAGKEAKQQIKKVEGIAEQASRDAANAAYDASDAAAACKELLFQVRR